MSTANDARFWDRTSRRYAAAPVADQVGYERTLARTRDFLKPDDRVLELGCGTGSTALLLAPNVRNYLATDISSEMIAIAEEKHAKAPVPGLAFRVAVVEELATELPIGAVLGFNYLHLVRDLPATLRHINALLESGGLFISKTPCLGDMNPLIRRVLLPAMHAIGQAPHASAFRAEALTQHMIDAGFEIVATESHASKGKESLPYIVARKP